MSEQSTQVECLRCKNLFPAHMINSTEVLCVYCLSDEEEALPSAKQTPREKVKKFSAQEEAKIELAARELTRKRLLPFVERFNNDYEAGWVHKDICQRLEKFSEMVEQKQSPRLMLFLPPRHGKSTLASIAFPAWHLGRNPSHEFISCSYSGSLAMGFSRKVRGLLRETEL